MARNLEMEVQAQMVKWIRMKINSDGMIDKPITFKPTDYYSHLQKVRPPLLSFCPIPLHPLSFTVTQEVALRRWTFTSFPVVDEWGKLLGLITRDEMDFVSTDDNPKFALHRPCLSRRAGRLLGYTFSQLLANACRLGDMMKKLDQIITAPDGTTSNDAYQIMQEKKVKKLPVVSQSGTLMGSPLCLGVFFFCGAPSQEHWPLLPGMYVWGDLKRDVNNKDKFSLDEEGHFLVAAAIGLGMIDLHMHLSVASTQHR